MAKHCCPMCGEQWNEDVCTSCGWFEGKPQRYTAPRKRRIRSTPTQGQETHPFVAGHCCYNAESHPCHANDYEQTPQGQEKP